MKSFAEAEKGSRSLRLCFHALSNWLQEELLSQLTSIVFDRLYCSVLSTHGVVPHRHTPSTELILLHDQIMQRTTYALVQLHAGTSPIITPVLSHLPSYPPTYFPYSVAHNPVMGSGGNLSAADSKLRLRIRTP